MKIYVEASMRADYVTALNAKENAGFMSITRDQYESAAKTLNMAPGDFLRLAPVGDSDAGSVTVLDGKEVWKILD